MVRSHLVFRLGWGVDWCVTGLVEHRTSRRSFHKFYWREKCIESVKILHRFELDFFTRFERREGRDGVERRGKHFPHTVAVVGNEILGRGKAYIEPKIPRAGSR